MLVLSYNHAQQKKKKKTYKPSYKIYIFDFCSLFESMFVQLSFIKPSFFLLHLFNYINNMCIVRVHIICVNSHSRFDNTAFSYT
jgi:hypothetical protein